MAAMTSATEELLRLLDERGVEFKTHDVITGKAVTWHGSVCDWVALPDERGLAVGVYKDYLTPEQAIAATLLGSEPDEIELTQTYDVGFRNGVMAVYQQLEGIEDYEELQELIAEYWEGGEGCDEP